MRYFYLLPFRKQFFFPYSYKTYPFLLGMFHPYSRSSRVLELLWKWLPGFKYLFTVSEDRIPVPISVLKKYVDNDSVFAFNTGTKGPEQKITVLGVERRSERKFFLKYAEQGKAKDLVKKEIAVLSTYKDSGLVPKIFSYDISEKYVIMITEFVSGKKYGGTQVNQEVFQLLLKVAGLGVVKEEEGILKSFAHGDFCPWNIFIENEELKLIDWEMGEYLPIGYDILTFIYQTNFLLYPKKKLPTIFQENVQFIQAYFAEYGISDYVSYMRIFSQVKIAKKVALSSRYEELRLALLSEYEQKRIV